MVDDGGEYTSDARNAFLISGGSDSRASASEKRPERKTADERMFAPAISSWSEANPEANGSNVAVDWVEVYDAEIEGDDVAGWEVDEPLLEGSFPGEGEVFWWEDEDGDGEDVGEEGLVGGVGEVEGDEGDGLVEGEGWTDLTASIH